MTHIMSCDFNKYDEIIATSSADKSIKLWDLRNLQTPINVLTGHRLIFLYKLYLMSLVLYRQHVPNHLHFYFG